MTTEPVRRGALAPHVWLEMTLGECPLWHGDSAALWWVDIVAGALHRLDRASREHRSTTLDEAIACVGLSREGGLVAGTRSGIWQLDAAGAKIRQLAANPEPTADHRFNDGRVGPDGRLWLGTMNETGAPADAGLYSFDGEKLVRRKTGITISNGLAFSPDGEWLYHADTPSRCVYRHAFSAATGAIGPGAPWLDFNRLTLAGNPDGAAVDAEGHYWVALFGGGAVARFDSEARFVAHYPLAAPNPTMPAFGGPERRTLFVTTAREHMDAALGKWPAAGSLFAMETDAVGLAEPVFTGV